MQKKKYNYSTIYSTCNQNALPSAKHIKIPLIFWCFQVAGRMWRPANMARPITAVYFCLVILAHLVKGSTTLNITGNRSNISRVVQWTGGVGGPARKFNTTQILNRIVNQDLAGGNHNSTYNKYEHIYPVSSVI